MKQLKIYIGICALALTVQVHPMHSKIDFTDFTLEQLRKFDIKKLSSESMDDYNLAYEQALAQEPTSPNNPSTPISSFTNVSKVSSQPTTPLVSPRRTPSNPCLSEQIDCAAALAAKKSSLSQAHSAPVSPAPSPAPAATFSVQYASAHSSHSSSTTSASSSHSSTPRDHAFADAEAAPLQPANNLPVQRAPSPIRQVEVISKPGYPPAYQDGSEIRPAMNIDGTNPSPRGAQFPESQWRSEKDLSSPGQPEPDYSSKLPSFLQTVGIALVAWTTAETIMAYKNISEEEWRQNSSVAKKARLIARATTSAMCARPRQLIEGVGTLLKNIAEEK